MEYTYKNSVKEESQTVTLSDYSLTLKSGDRITNIPYANITSVRLCRVGSVVYKTILYHDTDKPIIITNLYVRDGNLFDDRSRMYATFVRVLHYHLKDKSTAVFSSGCSIGAFWRWGAFSIILSFIITFTADYMGLGLINPYLQTLILGCITTAFVFFLYQKRWPKEYQATDIPLTLLP